MKKRLLLLCALCCCLLLAMPVLAEKQDVAAPLDWEISVRPKPTQEEMEQERWSHVFANAIGLYAFDNKSLQIDEADKNLVHVLVKTIFTDPKVIGSLNEKYKEKLTAGDKVSHSQMQMVFQIRQKTYAVAGAKVFSQQGTLLEDRRQTGKFAPVPPKTFADSMYDIAKNYERNN